jgi:hypothetical protein
MEQEVETNEMKLKMLIKFDQIKLLEDFYNKQMDLAKQPDRKIYLDVEIDEVQLRYIVERLYKQNTAMQAQREKKHQESKLWAKEGIISILRHLLMTTCKHSSKRIRLRYAFMMFKAVASSVKETY